MEIIREPQNGFQTLGQMNFEGYTLATMELPWRDNQRGISCIPCTIVRHKDGDAKVRKPYKAVPRYSKKYGNHFIVKDVPNRSYILFHSMNYFFQGRGCIGVGMYHKDINGDGLKDTVSSKDAMAILLEKFPEGFEFDIIQS